MITPKPTVDEIAETILVRAHFELLESVWPTLGKPGLLEFAEYLRKQADMIEALAQKYVS